MWSSCGHRVDYWERLQTPEGMVPLDVDLVDAARRRRLGVLRSVIRTSRGWQRLFGLRYDA
jgi:hypothetical protein